MQTLKEYAELNGLTYHTAREHAIRGKIVNARRDSKGKIFICTDEELKDNTLRPVTEIKHPVKATKKTIKPDVKFEVNDKATAILNNLAPALRIALAQNYDDSPCKINSYTKDGKLHFDGYIDMKYIAQK